MNATQTQIQTAFAAILALIAGLTFTMVGCSGKRPPELGEKFEPRHKDVLEIRTDTKPPATQAEVAKG